MKECAHKWAWQVSQIRFRELLPILAGLRALFGGRQFGGEPVPWVRDINVHSCEAPIRAATVRERMPANAPSRSRLCLAVWCTPRFLRLADLPTKRTARVMLCLYREHLVALHGFIKKTRATPGEDLALARQRQKELMR